MPITLTGAVATQFIEQPDREIIHTIGGLSRMTVTRTGPYWLADKFMPHPGSRDSVYPQMYLVSVNRKNRDGALVDLVQTYAGRVDYNGIGQFTSETLTGFSSSEKELTYQNFFAVITGIVEASTGSMQGRYQWKVGVNNIVKRYITRNVTYKYVTSFKPSGPQFTGNETAISSQYDRFGSQGSTTLIFTQSSIAPSASDAGLPGPFGFVQMIRCTQLTAEQAIGPWYTCSETWEIRFEASGQ